VNWAKPPPLYVWLLIAAGASGVVAFGARYLARRMNATAPSEEKM
jgi:hypothetical protein